MQEVIKELIKTKMYKEILKYLSIKEPEDIAMALNGLSHEDMVLAYRLLPKEKASQVFVNLESDFQEKLINLFSDKELKEVSDKITARQNAQSSQQTRLDKSGRLSSTDR